MGMGASQLSGFTQVPNQEEIAIRIETLLAEAGIDGSAASDLRACPPNVMQLVLDGGTLVGTNNPSGALIGRIKRARLQVGGNGFQPASSASMGLPASASFQGFAPNAQEEELAIQVEMFLQESGADESSSNDLRGYPPEVMQLVLNRGTLAGSSNPSASLIGRIKQARIQAGGGGFGSTPSANMGLRASPYQQVANPQDVAMQVEAFLAECGADESSSNDLRKCPPQVQQKVLVQGALVGSTNPSASLIGRIRRARLEVAGIVDTGRKGGAQQMGGGCLEGKGSTPLKAAVTELLELLGRRPGGPGVEQALLQPLQSVLGNSGVGGGQASNNMGGWAGH